MAQNGNGAGPVSRRSLLGAAGLAAVAVSTGCSQSKSSAGSGAAPPTTIPDYIAPPKIPGAIESDVAGVDPAAKSYPKPYKTVDKMPPCSGSTISEFTLTWGGQVPGVGKNKAWKWLGSLLDCSFKPTITPADSYDQKIATLLAGGDLPDLMVLNPTPTVNKAMHQGAFADLTEVLAGSAIKDWPNIGWTRPEHWKLSAVDGKIYGIPIYVPEANTCIRIRADYAKKLGMSEPPADADEFYDFATELPKAGVGPNKQAVYGLGTFSGGNQIIDAMFEVPNNWRLQGGKLISRFETDEFAQAMEYAVKLWKGGGFHPDALALADQGAKVLSLFNSGQLGMNYGLNAIGWFQQPYSDVVSQAGGAEAIAPYVVPKHDGSGAGTYYLGPGIGGWVGLSAEAAKDTKRRTELLNLINWFKAPWGSEEYNQRTFGKLGTDWDFDSHGVPAPKESSSYSDEIGTLTYGYRDNVWYQVGQPTVPEVIMPYQEAVLKAGVKDPAAFIPSSVSDRVSSVLEQVAQDHLNGIVSGRRPLSDLKTFIADWKKKGGDQLRADLEKGVEQRETGR